MELPRPADHPLGDRLTVTLHHLVDELDAYADDLLVREHGVTLSQYVFLAVLSDLDRPDLTSLARCLRVSKAAVSKRVGSFVRAGWVRTHDDPRNARRVLLELTPAGRTLVDVAGRRLEHEVTAALDGVAGVDVPRLHADLTTVLAAVRTTLATPAPPA